VKLAIEGMHCEACVRRVQKAIEKVEGVQVGAVEVGSATVEVRPEQEQAVLEAVRKAGYPAQTA
jgi:copper chaperone